MSSVLYTNGCVLTMDPVRPFASAIAVEEGRIVGVGSADEVGERARPGSARVVDLDGRIVTPGFNDCHMHLLPYGLDLSKADLSPTAGVNDVPSLVSALCRWADANPRSEWVLGSRYDQNIFPGAAHPTRWELDRAFPDRPVYITQTSKHAAACNSAALRRAGITRETPDPPGAQIARDARGEPTGVLFESAMELVSVHIPGPNRDALIAAIRRANDELVKQGVTSASDLNVGWLGFETEVAAYREAAAQGAPLRTTLFPHAPEFGAPTEIPAPRDFAREMGLVNSLTPNAKSETRNPVSDIRLGAIKLFADGALTVRTAALREPYVDGSGSGILLHEPEELRAYIVAAGRQGWQIAVHAIGDRAVELVLDCYTATTTAARRHRIEHAMLIDDDLIRRFAEQQVIPVVQPEFISRLGDAYVLGLGIERAERLNPTASLQRAGLGVPFSSDCPIVPGAPLDGIRAAAKRTTRNGTLLGAEECISPMDGLRNYTYWAAYSTFDETEVGTIAPEMRADLAILDGEWPDSDCEFTGEHLDSLSVAATVIGGEVVYGNL